MNEFQWTGNQNGTFLFTKKIIWKCHLQKSLIQWKTASGTLHGSTWSQWVKSHCLHGNWYFIKIEQSWFTNPDRHCGIWITWLIGRTVVDLDCSLQALARCCRQTTCHIDMTEWAQTWLDSARRPCQCSANDNIQVTCHRITQAQSARKLVIQGT